LCQHVCSCLSSSRRLYKLSALALSVYCHKLRTEVIICAQSSILLQNFLEMGIFSFKLCIWARRFFERVAFRMRRRCFPTCLSPFHDATEYVQHLLIDFSSRSVSIHFEASHPQTKSRFTADSALSSAAVVPGRDGLLGRVQARRQTASARAH